MADNAPVTVYVPSKRPKGYEAGGYGRGRKGAIGGKGKPRRRTIAHGGKRSG
jgi:hypothetical protein